MQLFGSSFESGDTLSFTPPEGGSIASNAVKLTFISSGEIDYQFNDGSDVGSWSVRVNSPDGLRHSSYDPFTVAGGSGAPSPLGVDYRAQPGTARMHVNVPVIHSDGYQFVGEYIGNALTSGYLTLNDAQTLGLPIVSIYERSPDHIGYFTIAQADADASGSASAITAAESVAHQPRGTAIYFTVDPAAE